MEPLAYRIRPKDFSDVVGQDHLVGENGVIKKMLDQGKLFSLILYGPPGIGKTTIAKIIASKFSLNVFEFNASVDNKEKLKDISSSVNYYDNTVVIIDEIHRMKKDIQDYLLPFLENGSLIIIGLTTENPYMAINPAIRSRAHIYRLNDLNKDDVIKLLKNVNKLDEFKKYQFEDGVFDLIADTSSCEVRTALNMFEALTLLGSNEVITVRNAERLLGKKAMKLDSHGNNYYDILSALQKSIRGSDVDASLHYLARLITLEDMTIITRRLLAIFYEDISLGNPGLGPRVVAACEAAKMLGFPEARLPLAHIVVDMALSPKSNTTMLGIDKALAEYQESSNLEIPKHILNREIGHNGVVYKYPHEFAGGYVVQQYLPDELLGHKYYIGKDSGAYEKALLKHQDELEEIKKKQK